MRRIPHVPRHQASSLDILASYVWPSDVAFHVAWEKDRAGTRGNPPHGRAYLGPNGKAVGTCRLETGACWISNGKDRGACHGESGPPRVGYSPARPFAVSWETRGRDFLPTTLSERLPFLAPATGCSVRLGRGWAPSLGRTVPRGWRAPPSFPIERPHACPSRALDSPRCPSLDPRDRCSLRIVAFTGLGASRTTGIPRTAERAVRRRKTSLDGLGREQDACWISVGKDRGACHGESGPPRAGYSPARPFAVSWETRGRDFLPTTLSERLPFLAPATGCSVRLGRGWAPSLGRTVPRGWRAPPSFPIERPHACPSRALDSPRCPSLDPRDRCSLRIVAFAGLGASRTLGIPRTGACCPPRNTTSSDGFHA